MINDPHYIGCPNCDTVHRFSAEELTVRTRCARCGYRLTLGRQEAVLRVTMLALTSLVLMGLALFAPFLTLNAGPFESRASVIDVIFGFAEGIMVPLSFAVMFFIVLIPALRSGLLIYALAPDLAGVAPAPLARPALRLAFKLKPWAMAEIFMVGVAVALVKLAGMATVATGAAFWAFALLVLVNAAQDSFMCRNTLWTTVGTSSS